MAALAQDISILELRWPAEAEGRAEAKSRGQARLLLVESGVPAPICPDPLEDWVRIEDPTVDRSARRQALVEIVRSQTDQIEQILDEVVVDEDDLVHVGDRWASLPHIEAELVRVLLHRRGAVVGREVLLRAGWPEGSPKRNDLDVHISRLRRRLAAVGLVIRTVRSRGYVLNLEPDPINITEG